MANKKAKAPKPHKAPAKARKAAKPRRAKAAKKTGARKSKRPEEPTFRELGSLKDAIAMRHAKSFADQMYEHEEALAGADGHKQAVFQRMRKIGAEHFTGHGYEFDVLHGEDKFTVRKVKRGSTPAKETPVDEGAEPSQEEIEAENADEGVDDDLDDDDVDYSGPDEGVE